jgi:acetyltransferase-like isoleucine patch superfamily enzyme
MNLRRSLVELRDRRRGAKLVRQTTRALTPPPAGAFASYGEGTVIVPPARIEGPERIWLAPGVLIHEHAWLAVKQTGTGEPALVLEERAWLHRFVKIVCFSTVRIGPGVVLSDRVYISDVEYEPGHADTAPGLRPLTEPRPVSIGRDVFVGVGAVIKPGVTLGDFAYVGAGAVVEDDVPARSLAVGAPARIVKRWDRQS